ncbi:phosphodiesterase [Actinocrinis puniceicyclus]|uniref:Phosphodiesterase n=1 Tax=Actinocrinis puniceicyclus TaxID=977794 RepID=A0A8J7WNM3_9ACTN|nr:phosphodiesterase [Actinocrinis puniceicyclus]MBS2963134.1 phosphodiesterase [Actinocrinis puniceicyclus]
MITVAHVSDVHIGTSERNEHRARRVFAHLARLPRPVDAVVVTGDIADHGAPEEYDRARALIAALPYPVFTCPGNHDELGAYVKGLLGEEPPQGPVNRVRTAAGAVFAMCDSTVPGRPGGYLADPTLQWLDAVLADAGDAPVFVCFHHPPVVIHAPYLDEMRQSGGERLAAVLDRHRNVAAVLTGHAHTPAATTFAGRPLLIAPSVISTVTLPWEGDGLIDNEPPAALAFHVLDDERRLITHFRVVA